MAVDAITRYGLEEYVADCVITLDHRVTEQISTRRLRVLKYRGSAHGTNEYPFLIGERGFSVLPITSLRLDHAAPDERLSTGIARLDEMLGGRGVFRGSSVLVAIKKQKAIVIDTRAMLAFGGGHIPESLNIGGLPELSIWAGWFLDPDRPILLVLENDEDVSKIVPDLLHPRTTTVELLLQLGDGLDVFLGRLGQ